jgi:hypothetical protein
MVNITAGPKGLVFGQTVSLPIGVNVRWIPYAQGVAGAESTFSVNSCSAPLVAGIKYCQLPLAIPTNTKIVTSYGTNLTKSSVLWVISNVTTTFNWYGVANGYNGYTSTYSGSKCTTPLTTTGAFCDLTVSAMYSIDVRGGPQAMMTGYKFLLPKGPGVIWRTNYYPSKQGYSAWYQSQNIACSGTSKALDSEGVRTAKFAPEDD